MSRKAFPQEIDQQRWKKLFEGSLSSLNGVVPASKQPIFRPKQDRFNMQGIDTAKAAIATAAASLAALWQISTPKRAHGSE